MGEIPGDRAADRDCRATETSHDPRFGEVGWLHHGGNPEAGHARFASLIVERLVKDPASSLGSALSGRVDLP